MAEPIEGRPLAAQVYALGLVLKKSAAESYSNSLGLGSTEWPILASLTAGPSSLAALCERLSRDKGQVSRDIATLVERGMVVKSKHPNDSRQVVIQINRDNHAVMAEVERITEQRHRLLTAGLDDKQQRELHDLISRLYENARNPRMFDI
jgi:DNA-binding MarR family transcriptional regulator